MMIMHILITDGTLSAERMSFFACVSNGSHDLDAHKVNGYPEDKSICDI